MPEGQRVAIVTGAGTNIGRSASIRLASDRFAVILAGRRIDKLEETAELIRESGGDATVVGCDVADESSVDALFALVESMYGRLDLLFNNAGNFGSTDLLEDLSLEVWQRTLDTNLTGTFLCTRAAFRIMKRQDPMGGRIINNGSISADSPRDNSAAYTATKHGVTGLTKQTSLDGRKYDIACGQIDIGIATENPNPERVGLQIDVTHVGDAISYMAGLPLGANVLFMTVMPSKMPFVGRG